MNRDGSAGDRRSQISGSRHQRAAQGQGVESLDFTQVTGTVLYCVGETEGSLKQCNCMYMQTRTFRGG